MTQSQFDLKSIFLAALDRPEGPERTAYLDLACRDEPSLKAQAEQLLEAHVRAGVFLTSAAETAAPVEQNIPDDKVSVAPTAVAAELHRLELAQNELASPSPIAEGPGSRIGPYIIIRKLGEGGMGIVFLAEQDAPRPSQGRAEGYQAGHGHHAGNRPLRGRAPGPRLDGPSRYCAGPRRRRNQ